MSEDLGNYHGLFDGGNDFQGTATVGVVFDVDIQYPSESAGPADAGRC